MTVLLQRVEQKKHDFFTERRVIDAILYLFLFLHVLAFFGLHFLYCSYCFLRFLYFRIRILITGARNVAPAYDFCHRVMRILRRGCRNPGFLQASNENP